MPDEVAAISNFEAVDPVLWRGGAPSVEQYRALGDSGVTTVIDLRAEEISTSRPTCSPMSASLVSIPIRDGQTPRPAQVQRFLDAVAGSEAPSTCTAAPGSGRTGTMAAAYRARRVRPGCPPCAPTWRSGRPRWSSRVRRLVGPGRVRRAPRRRRRREPHARRPATIWKAFEGL